MTQPRTIKKYPNRRLYDTAVSSYITLEDVRQLVLDQAPFIVRDAKSKEDITRSILLQIIMEQEEDGEPLFSEQVLAEFIRFYGGNFQAVFSTYLEKSVKLMVDQQGQFREQMEDVITKDPLSFMRDVTEQNLALWKEMQDGFFRGAFPAAAGPRPPSARGDPPRAEPATKSSKESPS